VEVLGNTPIPRERTQKENDLKIDWGVAISKSSAGIFGFLVGMSVGRSDTKPHGR
jgi:H+/Cl- antiporter ClcA